MPFRARVRVGSYIVHKALVRIMHLIRTSHNTWNALLTKEVGD